MSILSRFLGGFALLLLTALPAAAVQPIGSAAWTTTGWTTFDGKLYEGPGTVYELRGEVKAGIRVRVDRCSGLWCQIHTAKVRGWLPLGDLSFGQKPGGWLSGPKFPTQRGGSGQVCFYDGANFTGESLCAGSGHVVKDLHLIGYDNEFSSVKVGDGVSALVCRDRGFRSYCLIVDVSKGHLEGLLDNGISSIEVY